AGSIPAASTNMFYTYILWSDSKNIYYVGHTHDLNQRLEYHNNARSNFTKRGIPWKLVYSEEFRTKSEAARHERFIKNRKSKKFIENLIAINAK
ncbi:MAG: GIY-YIG nuclease family protein, partial [Bacteroidota bacterium]|nr:GIY-YIG nuclease family protein [Bacteroidota bacterium]